MLSKVHSKDTCLRACSNPSIREMLRSSQMVVLVVRLDLVCCYAGAVSCRATILMQWAAHSSSTPRCAAQVSNQIFEVIKDTATRSMHRNHCLRIDVHARGVVCSARMSLDAHLHELCAHGWRMALPRPLFLSWALAGPFRLVHVCRVYNFVAGP